MSLMSTELSRWQAVPFLWKDTTSLEAPPDFFDERQLPRLVGWTQRMMHFDRQLARRLTEKRIRGLKVWEYGNLLSLLAARPESRTWTVLDVGPGNSSMPLFVADRVDRVITIDYADALEPRNAARTRASVERGVPHVAASMLDMPFAAGIFDLVTCISTIEHLDDLGNGRQVPYDEFLARTRTATREMARVLRPGGYLYITTDACIPELQPIDSWSRKRPPGDVRWSIYGIDDIPTTFLGEANDCGLQVISSGDFSARTLIDDARRSSYRGRYCTTFILFACKLP